MQLLKLSDKLPEELSPSLSDKAPLPGAVGWPADDDHEKVAASVYDAGKGAISKEVARHLGDTYGMCALEIAALCVEDASLAEPIVQGRPEVMAQIDWAVNRELAFNVSDFMIRRAQLFYRDKGTRARSDAQSGCAYGEAPGLG